ncbi:MAG: hypothetical protein FWC72_01385 [Oscillospiraceae bacterium]|nr:hypothetical protein [Oscillospiraceae bacterium]
MAEFMAHDPWGAITSRNGIAGDLLVSALQKSIRRGEAEIAVRVAYEMYITSPQFLEKLWRRLLVISAEDIGFGEPSAPILVDTLNRMRQEFPYNDGDQPVFFFHAIRYLCRQKKERSTDELKNIVIKEFEQGAVPEIPDYALDMHTAAGRALGRDEAHFLLEGSKVIPHDAEADDGSYKKRLLEIIAREKEGAAEQAENPFIYANFQF